MIRRRLVIEWDDDGVDTDEDCLRDFLKGDWSVQDLVELQNEVNLKARVEDVKP